MTEGNGSWLSDSFIPWWVCRRIILLFLSKFIIFHQINSQYLFNRWDLCKSMACRCALSTYVFKCFACIKLNNSVLFTIIKTLNYDIDCILAELPYGISHLIIKLGGCIEHILSKCSNSSPPYFTIWVSQCFDKLTCNIYFS